MLLKTAKLCQWPQRPSTLWNLQALGHSEDECLDFDFSVVDFWDWYEAKSEERVQVREKRSDKLKDGHTWAPKYSTVNAILKLYYEEHGESAGVALDPVAARMTDEEILGFLDPWDGDATES